MAKKSKFETEAAAVTCDEIAGVIPPFGLEIRMREMVARKFIAVAGRGGLVLGRYGRKEDEKQSECCAPIPHG